MPGLLPQCLLTIWAPLFLSPNSPMLRAQPTLPPTSKPLQVQCLPPWLSRPLQEVQMPFQSSGQGLRPGTGAVKAHSGCGADWLFPRAFSLPKAPSVIQRIARNNKGCQAKEKEGRLRSIKWILSPWVMGNTTPSPANIHPAPPLLAVLKPTLLSTLSQLGAFSLKQVLKLTWDQ